MNRTSNLLFTLILTLVFSLIYVVGEASSQSDDTLKCLSIKGKILNATKDMSACKVELLDANGIIDSITLKNGKKSFKFSLIRNSYYAIRITKPGYITRLISIDTKFPQEINDVCTFAFNTELITEEDAEGLNKDALDFPVAIIHFDNKTETFTYAKEYTLSIKQETRNTVGRDALATANNH